MPRDGLFNGFLFKRPIPIDFTSNNEMAFMYALDYEFDWIHATQLFSKSFIANIKMTMYLCFSTYLKWKCSYNFIWSAHNAHGVCECVCANICRYIDISYYTSEKGHGCYINDHFTANSSHIVRLEFFRPKISSNFNSNWKSVNIRRSLFKLINIFDPIPYWLRIDLMGINTSTISIQVFYFEHTWLTLPKCSMDIGPMECVTKKQR